MNCAIWQSGSLGKLVLHPHGIATTLLKFYTCSPGAGFILIISTKGITQIKKGKLSKKV